MSRPPFAVGIAVIVVLIVALAGGQAVAAQMSQGPEQPIGFTHVTHAGVLQLNCTFCHRNVEKGSNASVPSVQQCMFCHSVVNGESTQAQMEIDKLQAAFAGGAPIDWLRVHRLPDHVRFVHEAHITAGVSCATCHGNIPGAAKVSQIRSLKMGDCVSCHRQNNAPTDCTTCHK